MSVLRPEPDDPAQKALDVRRGQPDGRLGVHQQRGSWPSGRPAPAPLVEVVVYPGERPPASRVPVDRRQLPVGAVRRALAQRDVRPPDGLAEEPRQSRRSLLPAAAPGALEGVGEAVQLPRGLGGDEVGQPVHQGPGAGRRVLEVEAEEGHDAVDVYEQQWRSRQDEGWAELGPERDVERRSIRSPRTQGISLTTDTRIDRYERPGLRRPGTRSVAAPPSAADVVPLLIP